MIARLRAYLARLKRRQQIRQLERCLKILRPVLAKPAQSLEEVMERQEIRASVDQAEWALAYLRERV
jgi:hypothetical protein